MLRLCPARIRLPYLLSDNSGTFLILIFVLVPRELTRILYSPAAPRVHVYYDYDLDVSTICNRRKGKGRLQHTQGASRYDVRIGGGKGVMEKQT